MAYIKKGCYKLGTFEIEDNLICYTSLNRSNKIIAFSIIKAFNYHTALPILKHLVQKEKLHYFSVQISITNKIESYIVLCFMDAEKKNILAVLNVLKTKFVEESQIPAIFLDGKKLELHFLEIGFTNLNSKIHRLKSTNSFIIENERFLNILDIYALDLYELEKKVNFLYEFTNLIKRFKRQGFLIFNCMIKDSQMVISGYFVDQKNNIRDEYNLEYEINSFFECGLVDSFALALNDCYKILWRLDISNNYLTYTDIEQMFYSNPLSKEKRDFTKINAEIEKLLILDGLSYRRLSNRSFLINDKFMFLIFDTVDYKLLTRVFDQLYPKYNIVILVINDKEYSKIINRKKLMELPNVRIFNYEYFIKQNIIDLF